MDHRSPLTHGTQYCAVCRLQGQDKITILRILDAVAADDAAARCLGLPDPLDPGMLHVQSLGLEMLVNVS
jgi:hypothetical protein